MSEIEVLAQPVMGQRLWQWQPGKGLFGMREWWESGFFEASCPSGHQSPHWDPHAWHTADFPRHRTACLCGVNAYKLTHLFDAGDLVWAQGRNVGFGWGVSIWSTAHTAQPEPVYEPDCLPVLGIVELGGEVHEYDRGYRAQFGLIVEATVLTSLPIDPSALVELEAQYEAPFRVRSYPEWKEEWEATYGRDRQAEEENQDTEAAACGPGCAYCARAKQAAGQNQSLTFQNVASISGSRTISAPSFDFFQPEPRRRGIKGWWDRWESRHPWTPVLDLVMPPIITLIFLALLFFLLGPLTDSWGWTTWWESHPVEVVTVDGLTVEISESFVTNPFDS